jgi:mRNA interferase YafQ
MRKIRVTATFKKDLKKADKNPRQNTSKLKEVISLLAEKGEVPQEYSPHPLAGNWKPFWDCHIQPDFLLIYAVTETELHLRRCGSHSDLFG